MDKSELFKPRLPEEDVEIPGVGTVRVRGLSRAEALALNGHEGSPERVERMLISKAAVDPELTPEDVAKWQEAAGAGELEPVMVAITRLSGMEMQAKEAAKQAYRQFRGPA